MGGPSPILDRSGTSPSNDHGEFEVDNIREAEGHKPAPEETRTYRVGVTLEITADSESDAIALVRHEVRGLANTRRSSAGIAHAWVDARATGWCNAGECPSSVCLHCRESSAMSEVNCCDPQVDTCVWESYKPEGQPYTYQRVVRRKTVDEVYE